LDHPAFAGHFPGMPILPGVVLLDMALHAISVANSVTLASCEISAVKFLSPARPGDCLDIQHRRTAADTIRFDILSGARKIASGSIATSEAAQTVDAPQ
jgi:3-hydroxymyristoyl/3-hydroxydecanoyl-(acyl carrier protein) dehydratase